MSMDAGEITNSLVCLGPSSFQHSKCQVSVNTSIPGKPGQSGSLSARLDGDKNRGGSLLEASSQTYKTRAAAESKGVGHIKETGGEC